MAFPGPGKSPWDKQGNTPPNIDEFLAKLQQRFRFNMLNIWVVVGIVVLIWGLSGIFIVDPQEQAAVKQFGRLVRVVGPGPNYHLPYPIETVQIERVTEVKRLEIGYRTINQGPPAQYRDVPRESLMLTGDESIVDVQFIVQYVISDLGEYLFNARDVTTTIRAAAESAMREVIGRNVIDSVLTEGKAQMETDTKLLLSSILTEYGLGVAVQNVKLQDVQPPESVKEAFKAVANAREERERLINEAEGYHNDLLPRAKGEAEQIINQARSFAVERVNEAQGDTARFTALLDEYRRSKLVTRERLLLEALEDVLPTVNKVIVDESVGGRILPLLPLAQSLGGAARASGGAAQAAPSK